MQLSKPSLVVSLALAFAVFFSAGCAQMKTRKEISESTSGAPRTQTQEDEEDESPSYVPPGTRVDVDHQPMPEVKPQSRTAPKLGLILGAGGAKAFAHAGVLKALDTERIPVHAVVGLEWGSLMAGVFAQEGRVHNLDWKLYKLQDDDLPGQSLLSKAFAKDSIAIMRDYLKTVFENSNVESAKVRFACPTIATRTGSVGWMEKGPFRQAVEACLPYAPMFASKEGRFAAPFDLAQAAQWLRRQGADVVVFIDVLSEGDVWDRNSLPSDESSRLLWWEVQRHYRQGAKGIDEIIKVPLAAYNLGGFSKRKNISEVGLSSGKDLTRKLMQKYNF